jgi:DNA-3-methyladenine glycosylase I
MTLFVGPDALPRCGWAGAAPEFLEYHDNEWGFPVADDLQLFEKLCLESFQSGLSWRTILSKRENFRRAFAGFDFRDVAHYGPHDVTRLLADAGIVRHRGKIEAAIANAGATVDLVRDVGSLAKYVWAYEPSPEGAASTASPVSSSVRLSKDLRARGFRFVGPTTILAFMQASGLVNDHAPECCIHPLARQGRERFVLPT